MMTKIIIVDENDDIIGSKERKEVNKEIYRVSALWVTDSKNRFLLARRHHTKRQHPNKWGPAVAGTVEEGESYQENILHEAEEELGIKDVKFALGPKTKTEERYNHFTQWFLVVLDKGIEEFSIEEDEIEEIRWFTKEEFLEELKQKPDEFLVKMKDYVEMFNK